MFPKIVQVIIKAPTVPKPSPPSNQELVDLEH